MNAAHTIISALGGTGALAALIAALTTYLKSKSAAEDRKKQSHDDHKKIEQDVTRLSEKFDRQAEAFEKALKEKDATIRRQEKELAALRERIMNAAQQRLDGA